MGCDIHIYIEHRGYEEGRPWEMVASDEATFDHRNYSLFGVLAGVRRDGPPIAEPRGLPRDCSEEVRKRLEEPDYHSRTWFTLKELLDFDWGSHPERENCVDFLEWLVAMRRACLGLDYRPDEYRLIIAFEN